MRGENTVSPTPAGAGRFVDSRWPPLSNTGNPSANIASRIGGTDMPSCATFGYGGGNTILSAVYLGVPCSQFVTGPAAGQGNGIRLNASAALFKTTRNAIPPECDDAQCWRIIFNAAAQADTGGGDYELSMTPLNSGCRIVTDAVNGFGFRFRSLSRVDWVVRGPNGLVQTQITTAAFDTTAWHSYEMRITSATATVEASVAVLIDNVPVTTLAAINTSWAAGTNLPAQALVGGQIGFGAGVAASDGIASSFFVQQVRTIGAPTLANCL